MKKKNKRCWISIQVIEDLKQALREAREKIDRQIFLNQTQDETIRSLREANEELSERLEVEKRRFELTQQAQTCDRNRTEGFKEGVTMTLRLALQEIVRGL